MKQLGSVAQEEGGGKSDVDFFFRDPLRRDKNVSERAREEKPYTISNKAEEEIEGSRNKGI